MALGVVLLAADNAEVACFPHRGDWDDLTTASRGQRFG